MSDNLCYKTSNNKYNDCFDSEEENGDFAAPKKKGPLVDVIKTNY